MPSRRRALSFSAYARRRARLIGLTLVAVAATLLYLTLTDQGHEPLWRERTGEVQTLGLSPDGSTALVAVKAHGRIVGLDAFDAESGRGLWSKEVNLSSPGSIAAGNGWFALATPIPGPHLFVYAARNGFPLVNDFLEADPRAVAADGERLAVALRNGEVLVYENLTARPPMSAPPFVLAFDAKGGRVAAGTTEGRLVVWDGPRTLLDVERPLQIQSLRLSADGYKLVLGGRSIKEGDLSGAVEVFDLTRGNDSTPLWSTTLPSRVSLVNVDRAGSRVLALEESAPRYSVHMLEATRGALIWSRQVEGAIARDDGGRIGGVALSQDARFVALAPDVGGPVTLLDAANGRTIWTFAADGADAIAWPADASKALFVASARLASGRAHDTLVGFDATREPFYADLPRFAPSLVAAELALGIASLVIGYAWYRRN